ncbi:MAG: hypothetical protein C0414_01045 [Brevundimonas sp.]|nr:hypothetical protein [Brevundimonas sp.]TAJ51019.1 MAG: hypothetical protein EPO54_03930 [Brevundimonas sp.]
MGELPRRAGRSAAGGPGGRPGPGSGRPGRGLGRRGGADRLDAGRRRNPGRRDPRPGRSCSRVAGCGPHRGRDRRLRPKPAGSRQGPAAD